MAILHGSWLLHPHDRANGASQPDGYTSVNGSVNGTDRCFFIWGETWRRIDAVNDIAQPNAVLPHPFAMTLEELTAFLYPLQQAGQIKWAVADLPLVAANASRASAKRASKGKSSQRGASSQTLEVEATSTHSSTRPLARWRSLTLTLPTYRLPSSLMNEDSADTANSPVATTDGDSSAESPVMAIPQHSAAQVLEPSNEASASSLALQPWQVYGICLTPLEATQLLQALPLSSVTAEDSWLGGDLRFWSHVSRWQLDLLARAKFLPVLEHPTPDSTIAHWQALMDSATDQTRLEYFARHMPAACRTYQNAIDPVAVADSEQASFLSPPALLLDFLHHTTDAQIRAAIASSPIPPTQFPKDVPLREWLQALGAEASALPQNRSTELVAPPEPLEHLEATLSVWIAPLQHQLTQQLVSFRTCFVLQPPAVAKQADWTLEYYLQATYDPDFLVGARTIWSNPVDRLMYQGRSIDHPQETLLAGLGLASRLYPVLEPSLQTQQPESCYLSPLQVYEFIRTTAWKLQDSGFGVVLPPSLANQQGWANRLGLRIKAEPPANKKQRLGLQSLLNFKWELTIGGQRLSKAEFDRLVALNTPLVEINGEWVELRPQDIKAAQAFFENRKDQRSLSLEDALRISTGDTQMIEKLPVLNFEASGSLQELINTLTTGNQSVESIEIPQGFRGELRPYQVRGVSWLAFLERWGLGACLADDMGLGKTIQLIALLLHLQEKEGLDQPTLLICPTSVLGNWEREVKRFGPSLKVLVHHGDKRSQGKAFAKTVKGLHLVITSYALVYRDAKDLKSVSWQGVVVDEAQNIKNPEAKQSQAVRELDAQFHIALTGTPIENRLSELWSILDFLNPGYLGPRNFFQRRFAVPIERYGDTASLHTLRSLVQPFILRRLKTDRDIIQDLPEKQEMTVFCGLSAEQAALYQKLVDHSLSEIESAEGIQRHGMILALLTKLKQVCNHPTLFKPGKTNAADHNSSSEVSTLPSIEQGEGPQAPSFRNLSGKLQRLEEMLEEVLAEGDRCLIFTQFAEWGKLLQAYLQHKFERQVLFLYGSTSKKQREEMIDRFQNDPQGPRIFILSLKAGGVGLNLTRANHVFHFDRWWNPAVENQATDRVFRIGQTRNVQVHKFVCTGTLEERIHELIESKKALSEQVVGAGENWLTDFDTEQLRNLLLLDRAAVMDEEA
ncbi:DEAD/DEAH box helicase [Oculatella sp. LEGE 06141]|uniref:DEAD/DEAH box helicase n=1 Tax=Oculatella sp. LEGE 06141 TaxID=1828648 RepID=UPI001881B675|nr:DEAD/DEAH box helicase [Oculatella sp. LEGE 06141]MBE9178821.1 DEAD/DEAH box helicase [Oculatella sp. LEGE 06141]